MRGAGPSLMFQGVGGSLVLAADLCDTGATEVRTDKVELCTPVEGAADHGVDGVIASMAIEGAAVEETYVVLASAAVEGTELLPLWRMLRPVHGAVRAVGTSYPRDWSA